MIANTHCGRARRQSGQKWRDQQQERKRAALNSQRQRLHSQRAPTRCHGNTTSTCWRVRARTLTRHALRVTVDTYCISQQLVTLLQISGDVEGMWRCFLWWVASPSWQTHSSPEPRVQIQLRSVHPVRMGPAQQQQVESPFQACYLLLNKSAAGSRTQRRRTKSQWESQGVEALPPQGSRAHWKGGEWWDCLRRHVYVRTTCHSGQWPWQQALRSAE